MEHVPGPPDVKRRDRCPSKSLLTVVGLTGMTTLLGLGLAWAAYIRRYVQHDIPLTAALSGELRSFESQAGELAYYAASHGAHGSSRSTVPLLFVHSVNAAASSYELKPLYEHYAQTRRVYALDLPGFGFSERSNRKYTPQVYSDCINEFIESELHGVAVDIVSLSLSCEFVALAAMAKPKQYRTFTFIAPSGMRRQDMKMRSNDTILRILSSPAWSRLLFDTLTCRPALRYFLSSLQLKPLDRGLISYAYVTSHRPYAQVAPFHFVAGKLFTPSIFMAYQAITKPALAIFGQGRFSRHDMDDLLHAKSNWRVVDFKGCGALVHYDDPHGVINQMEQLFSRA